MGAVLIVLLILLMIGALPRWKYSRNWGYYPFCGFALIFIIVLIMILSGTI
jgi:hypothetical protein